MRNKKLAIHDQNEIAAVLQDAEWGVLGIGANNSDETAIQPPHLIPLNFVHSGNSIYFHGAHAGRKADLATDSRSASFVVVQAYSQLPSYFFDSEFACPATQLYKSIEIRGRLRQILCPQEKASALESLMRKLQPEGGYRTIASEDEAYRPRLLGVNVFALDIEQLSAKFKLGQDKTDEWRADIVDRLNNRGGTVDLETAEEIKRMSLCPFKSHA